MKGKSYYLREMLVSIAQLDTTLSLLWQNKRQRSCSDKMPTKYMKFAGYLLKNEITNYDEGYKTVY